MLVKVADNKNHVITSLEQLQRYPHLTDRQAYNLETELRCLRAGIKGEEESAYLIDFDFKESKNYAVIHDLRLEVNGRVAQIDHLVLNRALEVFVLETKHFNDGIKITEQGEFLRWNAFKKVYEGMSSPLEQNARHIAVLKDAFDTIDMPNRLGLRLKPSFISYVLVSPSARIDRPKNLNTSNVIKADQFKSILMESVNQPLISSFSNALGNISALAKVVYSSTLEDIAQRLCALHQPLTINYQKKFGIQDCSAKQVESSTSTVKADEKIAHVCRKCHNENISVQYGKYGYYFKCFNCDGNTPIKVSCDKETCKARIRKEGERFFRECHICNSSELYFTNKQ